MRLLGRFVPLPIVTASFLAVCLLVALVAARPTHRAEADEDSGATGAATSAATHRSGGAHQGPPPPPPPAPAGSAWSGFAFDACRAPSQEVMDRWMRSSPFTGVGIYLGGVHRACEQRHLDAEWVGRQRQAGWKLLPIWVGPQASCTGYDHRIPGRPGRRDDYGAARDRGLLEASRAAARAQRLGLPRGEVVFYDIEPFDIRRDHCRGSALAFLDAWTRELHHRGYRSGVYSHVKAGIALLSRAPDGYAHPDAVWYAWIDRVGSMPGRYVADAAFMRESRVHQFALDTRVVFGGVRMDIDWNFVSLGTTSRPFRPASCESRAGRLEPRRLRPGDRGSAVRVLQCLVLPGRPHPLKTSGHYDQATEGAVHAYQQRRGLTVSSAVSRRTWTSLLARGGAPVLRRGAHGEPVRRLQRSLNAALGHRAIRVDGSYGRSTARLVRDYRQRIGLRGRPVVTAKVWSALVGGRVLPDRSERPRR